jgi:Cysteine-rich CPCC
MRSSRYPCVCCGFLTLDERPPGTFEICPVCWWEDDNVQANDVEFAGGANAICLREAQENFRAFGAAEARFRGRVRKPRPDEVPPSALT